MTHPTCPRWRLVQVIGENQDGICWERDDGVRYAACIFTRPVNGCTRQTWIAGYPEEVGEALAKMDTGTRPLVPIPMSSEVLATLDETRCLVRPPRDHPSLATGYETCLLPLGHAGPHGWEITTKNPLSVSAVIDIATGTVVPDGTLVPDIRAKLTRLGEETP